MPCNDGTQSWTNYITDYWLLRFVTIWRLSARCACTLVDTNYLNTTSMSYYIHCRVRTIHLVQYTQWGKYIVYILQLLFQTAGQSVADTQHVVPTSTCLYIIKVKRCPLITSANWKIGTVPCSLLVGRTVQWSNTFSNVNT